MSKAHIINLGLIAHVDAGKTTLTEQFLHTSGIIRDVGRVDSGTAHTDYLQVERARGISVRSAHISFEWKGAKINLIDTPGHVDFISEVERALRVLDVAVLILSAVEGIQAQTRVLWEALAHMRIPTIFFINKTDRVGADIARIMDEIAAELSDRAFLIDETACERYALIEKLCDADDELMDMYLRSDGQITSDRIVSSMARQFAELTFLPVLSGAALMGAGIDALLNWIVELSPRVVYEDNAPLSALVYRVEHDAAHGRVAHVRMYGGMIKNRDSVLNLSLNKREKVFQIRMPMGAKREDAGILTAGDIGAVYGFSDASVGDVLGCSDAVPPVFRLTTPLLRVCVYAQNESHEQSLREALLLMSAEDPLLSVTFGHKEAFIHITGVVQLEIVKALVKERFDIDISFGEPAVIYKEMPSRICEGFEAYTMPKPCWAVIRFLIEPLPIGSGVEYGVDISNEKIHYRYQGQIAQTIPEALRQGPLGWEVTDIRITLIDGEDHSIHTHPLDFALATPLAVMDGLVRGGTTLLEPMLAVFITASNQYTGKIIGDMIKMRATFDSPVMGVERFTIKARVPVATSMDYPVQLRAETSGDATLAVYFDGYQPCPLELGAVCAHVGVDPRERSKYILWKRNAIRD